MRAAIYLRVSTEEQARNGFSLAAQREACREQARRLGAEEILEFADEGVSGALLQRPGLSALREAVRTGAVQMVVALDPDRLARNLSYQLLLTEEIERAKARLEFVNFEWRNTPEGQLFYAVRGAIAQYEKEKIRERTTRGRQQKAKSGRLPLAFRPYGYRYDPIRATLIIDESEAEVVRRMFRWLVSEGLGPNAIAVRLNQQGIPARKGGPWHRNVVRQILRNPVYTGTFYANRFDTTGLGLNRHRPPEERVRPRLRSPAEWIGIPVPAIVDPSTWQQAQEIMQQARRVWSGRPRAEYLLSGLVVCGRCGGRMTGLSGKEWGRRRRVYACRRAGKDSRACGARVDAGALEQHVWGQVSAWLQDPADLYRALSDHRQGPFLEQELEEVRQGLARVQQGKANLLRALEQGVAEVDTVLESLRRLQDREAALLARQAVLQKRLISWNQGQTPPADWAERVRRWWEVPGLSGEERRQLVRLLISRVEATEGKVRIFARWPGLPPAF